MGISSKWGKPRTPWGTGRRGSERGESPPNATAVGVTGTADEPLPRAWSTLRPAGTLGKVVLDRTACALRAVPGQRWKGGGMTRVPVHKGIGNHSAPVAFWT